MVPGQNRNWYLLRVNFVAALGGFLFGFDTAVISGSISFVKTQFTLSAIWEGWFVSSALVGCIIGVSFAGLLSDRFGRKKILLLSAFLFFISASGCALVQTMGGLIAYRLLGGIGVGVASMLSPLYISELSPPTVRGRMVALYQFAITIGILCAYFSNAWLLEISGRTEAFPTTVFNLIFIDEVWRGMFGAETVPAALFFILLIFIPESPRWLTVRGQSETAEVILSRVVGSKEARKQIVEIEEVVQMEESGLKGIFRPGMRHALLIGVFIAIMTQCSGINAIIYYGPRILNEAGFTISGALGGQVIIGVVNVLFTILAIWKIDDLGRKPLLILGVSGIVIAHVVIGILFYNNITTGLAVMIFILFFIACFAFSLGPVSWVLLSEIYPTNVRGRVMSIAVLGVWGATAIVGQLVPWLLENITPAGTFWLFAFLVAPTLIIAWKFLPETKGKSLEEIEKYWHSAASK